MKKRSMVQGAGKFQKNKLTNLESQLHLPVAGNIGERQYIILQYSGLFSNSCGGNVPFHENIYADKIVEMGFKSVSTKYADF